MAQRFIIYCLTNRVNGKRYIGQTKRRLCNRIAQHHYAARHDYKHERNARAIAAAIRKYGIAAFDREVLDVVATRDGANRAERAWIAHRRTVVPSGYNLNDGGSARNTHPETRRKLREKHTPEEWQQRNRRIAASLTPEQRREKSLRGAANQTPEERRAKSLKGAAAQTPEQRRAKALRAAASQTPEQRQAKARKALATAGPGAASRRALKRWAGVTVEARREHMMAARAALTPDERADRGRQQWAQMSDETKAFIRESARTPEARAKSSAARRAWWARQTPERISEVVAKIAATKARRAAKDDGDAD